MDFIPKRSRVVSNVGSPCLRHSADGRSASLNRDKPHGNRVNSAKNGLNGHSQNAKTSPRKSENGRNSVKSSAWNGQDGKNGIPTDRTNSGKMHYQHDDFPKEYERDTCVRGDDCEYNSHPFRLTIKAPSLSQFQYVAPPQVQKCVEFIPQKGIPPLGLGDLLMNSGMRISPPPSPKMMERLHNNIRNTPTLNRDENQGNRTPLLISMRDHRASQKYAIQKTTERKSQGQNDSTHATPRSKNLLRTQSLQHNLSMEHMQSAGENDANSRRMQPSVSSVRIDFSPPKFTFSSQVVTAQSWRNLRTKPEFSTKALQVPGSVRGQQELDETNSDPNAEQHRNTARLHQPISAWPNQRNFQGHHYVNSRPRKQEQPDFANDIPVCSLPPREFVSTKPQPFAPLDSVQVNASVQSSPSNGMLSEYTRYKDLAQCSSVQNRLVPVDHVFKPRSRISFGCADGNGEFSATTKGSSQRPGVERITIASPGGFLDSAKPNTRSVNSPPRSSRHSPRPAIGVRQSPRGNNSPRSSPRNSPRGNISPRNSNSPRVGNSSRAGNSPRSNTSVRLTHRQMVPGTVTTPNARSASMLASPQTGFKQRRRSLQHDDSRLADIDPVDIGPIVASPRHNSNIMVSNSGNAAVAHATGTHPTVGNKIVSNAIVVVGNGKTRTSPIQMGTGSVQNPISPVQMVGSRRMSAPTFAISNGRSAFNTVQPFQQNIDSLDVSGHNEHGQLQDPFQKRNTNPNERATMRQCKSTVCVRSSDVLRGSSLVSGLGCTSPSAKRPASQRKIPTSSRLKVRETHSSMLRANHLRSTNTAASTPSCKTPNTLSRAASCKGIGNRGNMIVKYTRSPVQFDTKHRTDVPTADQTEGKPDSTIPKLSATTAMVPIPNNKIAYVNSSNRLGLCVERMEKLLSETYTVLLDNRNKLDQKMDVNNVMLEQNMTCLKDTAQTMRQTVASLQEVSGNLLEGINASLSGMEATIQGIAHSVDQGRSNFEHSVINSSKNLNAIVNNINATVTQLGEHVNASVDNINASVNNLDDSVAHINANLDSSVANLDASVVNLGNMVSGNNFQNDMTQQSSTVSPGNSPISYRLEGVPIITSPSGLEGMGSLRGGRTVVSPRGNISDDTPPQGFGFKARDVKDYEAKTRDFNPRMPSVKEHPVVDEFDAYCT